MVPSNILKKLLALFLASQVNSNAAVRIMISGDATCDDLNPAHRLCCKNCTILEADYVCRNATACKEPSYCHGVE